MNPQQQESYAAGQVEPGWQLLVSDQWLDVGVVIETEETQTGAHFVTIVFEDAKHQPVKLRTNTLISARPPAQSPKAGQGLEAS